MALPIWANYMRSCYEVEDLNISKDEFTKPKRLSIKVNCPPRNKIHRSTFPPDIDF